MSFITQYYYGGKKAPLFYYGVSENKCIIEFIWKGIYLVILQENYRDKHRTEETYLFGNEVFYIGRPEGWSGAKLSKEQIELGLKLLKEFEYPYFAAPEAGLSVAQPLMEKVMEYLKKVVIQMKEIEKKGGDKNADTEDD